MSTSPMNVINGIEPGLYNLAILLDLLVDQTLELSSSHPDGRGLEERVQVLARACLEGANEVIADVHKLADGLATELRGSAT